jgi:hypothetical protein
LSRCLSEILRLAPGILKTRRRLKQFKPLILRFARNLSKAAAIRFQGIQAIDIY